MVKRKQAERALLTKQRVFSVAAEMFSTRPYEEINMTDIAEKANASVGTIYHYFESKYSILLEYYKQQSENDIND